MMDSSFYVLFLQWKHQETPVNGRHLHFEELICGSKPESTNVHEKGHVAGRVAERASLALAYLASTSKLIC